MTLAEQVARAERALKAYLADGDMDGCPEYELAAADAFPSLVARLREAESLIALFDKCYRAQWPLSEDELERSREFLKGRLST